MRRHERVPGARVHRDRHVLAHALQLRLERACAVGAEEVVVLGHVAAHRRVELRPVGLHVARREAVERDDGAHRVGRGSTAMSHASIPPMQKPTTPMPSPVVPASASRKSIAPLMSRAARSGGIAVISCRGLVHLGVLRELAVVQVGAERDEAGGGRAGRPSSLMPDSRPHHSCTTSTPGPRPARRAGEVAPRRRSVARELHHLGHGGRH